MDSQGTAPDFLKQKDWKTFDIAKVTQEEIDRMEEPIGEFFKGVTKADFFKQVVKRQMLGYPVASVKEIFEDPQHEARNFWQKVEHPELKSTIEYPGGFAKFSEGACQIWRRAPLIGEHNQEIYGQELRIPPAEIADLQKQRVI
jgi:crotonobetainyl-CoA:carnitine CoA-transferase CaiB-like acyl-CoA transferase